MAQIRPKILLRYGRINEPLRVPLIDLLIDSVKTILTADMPSGSGTLTVKNITGFAVNQILLIGEPGNQGSEIIKTHASTAPTGSTITLASNTLYDHSSSTTIRVINFDQVELSNAPTVSGVKTVMTTASLVANADTTNYNDVTNTSGFYYARFKNSISAAFSSYSDPAPYAGYTSLSARYIIDSALKEINKKQSEILSDEFAFLQINNCQLEVLREQKRWSWMQTFGAILGQVLTGQWRIAVPTDLDDTNTNRGIYNFHIGNRPNLTWVDKEKWDEITSFVSHTTLASILNVGDATATLTNSSDFGDTGTLQIGAYTYAYTANNRTTNVITLTAVVPASQNQASGADVFTGASLGEPQYWTIWGGYLYFFPVLASTLNQRNAYLDYYKTLTSIALDSDNVVLPDGNIVSYYLQWKFLKRLNNGEETVASIAARDEYIDRRNKLVQKDSLGRTFRLKPRVNSLREDDTFGNDSRRIRDGNFPNI